MTDIIFTSVELGLLYALMVLGVFLTFRILNFPDLTVDGSFATGAAATAIAIHAGIPGLIAIIVGFLAGFLAGSLTAFLHIRLGLGKILAGILSLSMLYTINLRLMGSPNLSLLNQENIISFLKTSTNPIYTIIFLLIVVLFVKFLLDWFLQTEFGLQFRATGDNESTSQSFAINTNAKKFLGIGLSNGLVGVAGGLVAQYQGFADVNMGIGTIILGLAALMLGEVLILNGKIGTITTSIIIGAILYQLIINFALRLGLAGTDLKFVTALIVVIALVIGNNKKYLSHDK
jgi:putative ABC transport system permease protein